jgi:hypothetical protein
MEISRRQFISYFALVFSPYSIVSARQNSFDRIIEAIQNPFQVSLYEGTYKLDEWLIALPISRDTAELSKHILGLIEKDYQENNVDLINGVIVSQTEVMLYLAKDYYA